MTEKRQNENSSTPLCPTCKIPMESRMDKGKKGGDPLSLETWSCPKCGYKRKVVEEK